jgi:hypothetical protein
MIKKIVFLLLMVFINTSNSQTISITNLQASQVENGVNVHLQTFYMNLYTYLEHTYTITGNQINVSVCYSLSLFNMNSNQTHNFFIPTTENINYTVNVTIYNALSPPLCDYTSIQTSQTTTLSNTEFEQLTDSIKLFPNPTTGLVNLEFNNQPVESVKLYNIFGQHIKDLSYPVSDICEFENGIYFIEIKTESGKKSKKIILNK